MTPTNSSSNSSTPSSPQDILAVVEAALQDLVRDGQAAIDRLLTVYADDVHFQDPLQTFDGKPAFAAMNRRLLEAARELSFDVTSSAAAGDQLFLTWRMRMATRLGLTLNVDGATHIRLAGGRIVEHRDYWDLLGAVMDSLPIVAPVYRTLIAKLG